MTYAGENGQRASRARRRQRVGIETAEVGGGTSAAYEYDGIELFLV